MLLKRGAPLRHRSPISIPRMNDTADLLGQLRIDRDERPPPQRGWLRWLLLAIAAAALAFIAWSLLRSPPALTVNTATAQSIGGSNKASVLDASGYVVARRQATVSSKVTGKVIDVLIEEGQAVKAGDVLARIDASNADAQLALSQAQAEAARAQLTEIQVQLKDARRRLTRAQELSARKLVSDEALDAARAEVDSLQARLQLTQENVTVAERTVEVQQRQVDDTIVRAPFDGVVTIKNAQPGEMISPLSAGGDGTRTGIGTLVDMSSLEIEVDVNENFINRVLPGQPVTARLNAYPDWQISSHVIAVIPTADRSKATVKVRIGFEQIDPRILPEMGVRVSFMDSAPADDSSDAAARGVRIPADAVNDGVVFVVNDGLAERRAVTVAGRRGDDAIISAGLRSGERVIRTPPAGLEDGTSITLEP